MKFSLAIKQEEATQKISYLERFNYHDESAKYGFFRQVKLREEESNPEFGFSPSLRPIKTYLKYGFIALDKPQGPTSHEVVAWVRRILGIQKAGHSGTLDPMVSGVLPIGLESATKAISALLLGPKEYVAIARIHDSVPDSILYPALEQFKGAIYQKPPQRSSVRRVTRTRNIYELERVEKKGNLLVLRVLCEAGTYIRKLIYDLGEVLSVGATMAELRRTKVCQLTVGDLVRLHDLFEANAQFQESQDETMLRKMIRPIEDSLPFLRQVKIRDSAVDSICHGAQLAVPGVVSYSEGLERGEIVCILTGKGELVALAESQMSALELGSAEHGIVSITNRVIMDAGTYPKMWKKAKEEAADQTESVSEGMLKKSLLEGLEQQDEAGRGAG